MEKSLALKKIWNRKRNEVGGKECFSLLQQVLASDGVHFSRNPFLKNTYHSLSPGLRNIFKTIISINMHGLKFHLMPLLH
jgi:hypothetical protein